MCLSEQDLFQTPPEQYKKQRNDQVQASLDQIQPSLASETKTELNSNAEAGDQGTHNLNEEILTQNNDQLEDSPIL